MGRFRSTSRAALGLSARLQSWQCTGPMPQRSGLFSIFSADEIKFGFFYTCFFLVRFIYTTLDAAIVL